ncbi:hypothetical protein [Caulobacter sp. LARHSG274]
MAHKSNSRGREANDALSLGERPDTSHADTVKTGRQERRAAGPDGGDARAVGETFKRGPGGKGTGGAARP